MNPHSSRRGLPDPGVARLAVLSRGERLGAALGEAFEGVGRVIVHWDVRDGLPTAVNRDFDVVFLTVPWLMLREHSAILSQALSNVVVVICTTAVSRDEGGYFMQPLDEGDVTSLASKLLPGSRIVGALQQFSAEHMELASMGAFESDAPVIGNDREAAELVEHLIDELRGFESVYAGGLDNAAVVEGLAAIVSEVGRNAQSPMGFRFNDTGSGGLTFIR